MENLPEKLPKLEGEQRPKPLKSKLPIDIERISDKALSLEERKQAYKRILQKQMNPKKASEFDPATFDPMDDDEDFEVKKRPRTEPPRRLPTKGLKPKEIIDGQLIGMFESKQDLYLLIAWLSERVSDLEDQLKTGKN